MGASREEIKSVLRCESTLKRPPYMPAIYEHKAFFIEDTPSNVSRDADLLAQAVLAEYAALEPDALTIGVDVYNLEAEAAGCTVSFYEGADTSIPGISPGNHVVTPDDDLLQRPVPNPLQDGRMPINIAATQRVVEELGDSTWIRGALSGPFSLAINLIGAEDFFLCCYDSPEKSKRVLQYSTDIIKAFGMAYIDVGADVILFDSQASPELLSPKMYEEYVLPFTKELIEFFKAQGVADVPLIIGGKTTRIIDSLIDTGANNLLCDFTADWQKWSDQCRTHGRSLRRNIDPGFVQKATPDEIFRHSKEIIAASADLPGFIMGTAVVPYGTPTENLLAVKAACYEDAV
jgi:uroporphyrinogen decarboxylase